MNDKDDEMERYLLKADHDQHCEQVFKQRDRWLSTTFKGIIDSDTVTKERVSKLEIFKDRIFWAILLGTFGIIATNIIGPRIVPAPQGIKELTGYIALVTEELQDQKELIAMGNKTSAENKADLDKIKQIMKGKY